MYIIEGNIGAGKSTFLKLVKQHFPEISIILEPVKDWQENTLLSKFYTEPKRWAYTMELSIMISRVKEHLVEQKKIDSLVLIERSIYSGYYCFGENDYDNNFFNNIEWTIFQEWFKFLVVGHCTPPNGFIYLKVAPETAHQRIQKRNRSSEESIPLSYLQELDNKHEKFLIQKKGILKELVDVPVLVLDCNEDFESSPEVFNKHIEAIKNFLSLT